MIDDHVFHTLTPEQMAQRLAPVPEGVYRARLVNWTQEADQDKAGYYHLLRLRIEGGEQSGRSLAAKFYVEVNPGSEWATNRTAEWVTHLARANGVPSGDVTLPKLRDAIVRVRVEHHNGFAGVKSILADAPRADVEAVEQSKVEAKAEAEPIEKPKVAAIIQRISDRVAASTGDTNLAEQLKRGMAANAKHHPTLGDAA